MGTKRKPTSSRPKDEAARPVEKTKYQINEKFADSEDDFFAGRDQILLDNGSSNKRQKLQRDDDFLQPSEEEVLGYDDEEDEDLENENAGSDSATSASERLNDESNEDNLRDWGTSKADYYNADVIETEADALEEEQEARRLQQKHLQNLTEADFGFDEKQWAEEDKTGLEAQKEIFSERLPELSLKEDASSEEKAQVLRNHYPEFEPLAKDFIELQELYEELAAASEAAEAAVRVESSLKQGNPGDIVGHMLVHQTPMATNKFRALSAYLGTIGMYFALLTSTTNSTSSGVLAMSPAQLRDHPVVQSLFRSRQLWDEIKDAPVPEIQTKNIVRAESKLVEAVTEPLTNGVGMPISNDSEPVTKKKRRTKAERAVIKAQELAEAERQVQMQKAEAKLADLDALISVRRKEPKTRPIATTANGGDDSDFGDEDALTAQEAAEKAHRKKSLRFYTSQIAQKSNKRGAASRDAGGDTDLPYKERLKDRQARLAREAEKKGQSKPGQDERLGSDGSGDDVADARLAKEIRGDDIDEDGYYDMVSARTQQKKDERKALAEAQARANEQGGQGYIEEEIGPDGKRAITYAIAKNKGLAPRRKKEVRNPRVKKKIRYEKALKKLGSIRQVYKGGEGRGGYGGELTGIKTNVLKGVKL